MRKQDEESAFERPVEGLVVTDVVEAGSERQASPWVRNVSYLATLSLAAGLGFVAGHDTSTQKTNQRVAAESQRVEVFQAPLRHETALAGTLAVGARVEIICADYENNWYSLSSDEEASYGPRTYFLFTDGISGRVSARHVQPDRAVRDCTTIPDGSSIVPVPGEIVDANFKAA